MNGRSGQQRGTGRPARCWPLLLLVPLALAGCRQNQGRSDLVEAELRTRDDEVRHLRSELQRAEMYNAALEQTLRDTRPNCPVPAAPAVMATDGPTVTAAGAVKEVTLGRQTGGYDEDSWPGDEGLQVVVVPKDPEGSSVKVPGSLIVRAFEISAEGLKLPLSDWEVPAMQLRKSWQNGLLSTGYFVKLPWKKVPVSEKLRVVVQFTVQPEGRTFEMDKDVTLRLWRGGPRPGTVPAPVEVLPPVVGPVIVPQKPPPPGPAARIGEVQPLPPARLLDPVP